MGPEEKFSRSQTTRSSPAPHAANAAPMTNTYFLMVKSPITGGCKTKAGLDKKLKTSRLYHITLTATEIYF